MNNSKVREIRKIVAQMFPEITDVETIKRIVKRAKKHYNRRGQHGGNEQRRMGTEIR